MPHLSRDQQKAMFAKQGNRNTRDSTPQFSDQPKKTGFIARLKQAKIRREQEKEQKRQEQEQRELAEIKQLEKQAEIDMAKEDRESKIQSLKEQRIQQKRERKEKLIRLRKEKFDKSVAGRLLAGAKKLTATPKPKKGKKSKSLKFI